MSETNAYTPGRDAFYSLGEGGGAPDRDGASYFVSLKDSISMPSHVGPIRGIPC